MSPTRRQTLLGIGIALTSGCLSFGRAGDEPSTSRDVPAACGSAPPWPSSEGGAANRGIGADAAAIGTPATTVRYGRVREGTAPVVTDDDVYVNDGEGVRAVTRGADEWRWATTVDGPFAASPLVDCATVYALSASELLALDVDDGSVRWRVDGGHGAALPNLVAVAEGVVAPTSRAVRAVSDGEERWRYDRVDHVVNGVGAVDDLVVATAATEAGGAVHAVDAADGSRVWRTRDVAAQSPPVLGDGVAYVLATDGRLHALDAATGEREWVRTVADEATYARPALSPREGVLFVATGNGGEVVAVDVDDGAERWRATVGDRVRHGVVHDGDTVYVPGDDVVALDAADGTERFRVADRTAVGGAALVDDDLYVTTADGLLVVSNA